MTRAATCALFWEAMSGAMAVELLLEEMEIDYTRVPVDMARGEHRSPGFLALNPTGQIPALRLPDGTVIGESAAIILTLGERYPGPLVPAAAEPDRPNFLRWLIFMAASPYMTFVQFNHPERFIADTRTHEALVDNARARLRDQFSLLDQAIATPWFLPRGCSALDLYLFMLIEFFPDRDGLLKERASLARLHQLVSQRATALCVRARHG